MTRLGWNLGSRAAVCCCSLLLAPLTSGGAVSQPPESTAGPRLTLVEAVERALDDYPAVTAARAQREAAHQALEEARAQRRPALSVTGSATQHEEPMVVTPIHDLTPGRFPEFDESLLQSTLTLDYKLFDGGGRKAEIRRRASEADATVAGLAAIEQAIAARTVDTYLAVLGRSLTLRAHDRRLAALEAEHRRVLQLLEVGRAADVELRRIAASLAAAQADRVRLATALDTAERDLARLIGTDVEAARAERLVAVALRSEKLPPRAVLEDLTLSASPTVTQARDELLAADAALAIAESGRWPEVHLVGNYLSFGSGEGDFTAEWNAGVRLAVPLYTGGARAKRIARAEANREAAAQALRLAGVRARGELDRALASFEEARARVASLSTAVEQFVEVARIERLRLEAEVGTQTDYLDSEADLLAARADLVEARHAEIATRVELARVTAQLQPAWLEQALETTP